MVNTLEEDEYTIEDVIDKRFSKAAGEFEYFVSWTGYGQEHNDWVPASAFKEPITIQLKTKSGRTQSHTINPGIGVGSSEKRKTNTKNGSKNKKQKVDAKTGKSRTEKTIGTDPKQKVNDIEKKIYKTKDSGVKTKRKQAELNMFTKKRKIESMLMTTEHAELCNMVAPWGGETEGVRITNTCTIDHILSCLFINFKKSKTFKNAIESNSKTDQVADVLKHVFGLLHDGRSDTNWTRARRIWLSRATSREENTVS